MLWENFPERERLNLHLINPLEEGRRLFVCAELPYFLPVDAYSPITEGQARFISTGESEKRTERNGGGSKRSPRVEGAGEGEIKQSQRERESLPRGVRLLSFSGGRSPRQAAARDIIIQCGLTMEREKPRGNTLQSGESPSCPVHTALLLDANCH